MRALIFQTGSLGDTLVSLPAIRKIRERVGNSCELWLLHENRPSAVTPEEVLRPTGLVDRYLTYPAGLPAMKRLSAGARLWHQLRQLGFSQVFYLLGSNRPTSRVYRDCVFFRLCGIPQRLGFHGLNSKRPSRSGRDEHPGPPMHESEARLQRLLADGLRHGSAQPQPPQSRLFGAEELEVVHQRLSSFGKHPERPLIAICPGTNQPAKGWPAENFVEIGRRLLATTPYEIVVVGGKGDRAVAAEFLRHWGSGINLCGVFSVSLSACLLSLCRLCLCLDSGPMHLAAAVGTPCVALFSGHNLPGRWDPPGDANLVLRHSVRCGGCGFEVCPQPDHPCMSGLTVSQVWDAVNRALTKSSQPVSLCPERG
jgi:ADP-heptose:LPS heptosyltransferase